MRRIGLYITVTVILGYITLFSPITSLIPRNDLGGNTTLPSRVLYNQQCSYPVTRLGGGFFENGGLPKPSASPWGFLEQRRYVSELCPFSFPSFIPLIVWNEFFHRISELIKWLATYEFIVVVAVLPVLPLYCVSLDCRATPVQAGLCLQTNRTNCQFSTITLWYFAGWGAGEIIRCHQYMNVSF